MNTSDHALGGIFFDTHAAIKKLREAGASEKLAEAQIETQIELFRQFADKELITKGYLDLRLKELESRVKANTAKWILTVALAQIGVIGVLIKLL